jgi:hypothetical protein
VGTNGQALAYVYFEEDSAFLPKTTGTWVHVMHLMTYRTSHRLIDVAVFRGIFGNKALNAESGCGAAV